jgi:hypothetical protein
MVITFTFNFKIFRIGSHFVLIGLGRVVFVVREGRGHDRKLPRRSIFIESVKRTLRVLRFETED